MGEPCVHCLSERMSLVWEPMVVVEDEDAVNSMTLVDGIVDRGSCDRQRMDSTRSEHYRLEPIILYVPHRTVRMPSNKSSIRSTPALATVRVRAFT
jgi:hypothetical protein